MSKEKRWVINNDPGILRKKADAETDLFIFGYACKIFRDDQKALEMDQGKQLIPWMGDETLKIDRYDARGHLSELSQFEGLNQDYVLTPEERRIEQLCDEERYRALHHNEEEQEMYQEEELKRLKQALSSDKEYGQVEYQYTDGAQPPSGESEPTAEDEDPFVPNPLLDIPENMQLPSSVKENQIIEKTAAHIASHGPQVEILIKTRQANNQKLSFLHVGSPLNPYYNFILGQIKAGRYKPGFMAQQEAESAENNQETDHYLHPSLAPSSTTVESAPSIPSIAYKPSSDCFYNLLVNKIRNIQKDEGLESRGNGDEPGTSEDGSPSKRYRRKRTHSSTTSTKPEIVPPQHVKEIISRLINFAHSRDLHPSEIASNLLKQDHKNLGFVKPGHKYHDYYLQQLQEAYKENIYNFANPATEVVENEDLNNLAPSPSYDPEKPTEEEITTSESSMHVKDSEKSNDVSDVSTPANLSQFDVPNQPLPKPAPVCFSIKKPKETERLEHMSAFPIEESSSESEEKEEKEGSPKSTDGARKKQGESAKQQTSALGSDEKSKKSKKDRSKKSDKNFASSSSTQISQTTSENRIKSKDRDKEKRHSGKNRSLSGAGSKEKQRKMYHSSKDRKSQDSKMSDKQKTRKRERSKSGEKEKTKKHDAKQRRKSCEGERSKAHEKEKRRSHEKERSKSQDKDRGSSTIKSHSHSPTSSSVGVKDLKTCDDLPALLEDPVLSPPVPLEKLEKKREERKKKVKEMLEKMKSESLILREESNQIVVQSPFQVRATTLPVAPSEGSIFSAGTFLPHGPLLSQVQKSDSHSEETKKDFEEKLREQVKQSLRKIAEKTLSSMPPISEEGSIDLSSAANSNGFETSPSCGRPVQHYSRTPSVLSFHEDSVQHQVSYTSSSSTFVSRTTEKSYKKKKHHKKRKKRKAHYKAKKRSYSDSSVSEDESSESGTSSSDSDRPHRKRHKKSSKRSHKRHKRRHRRHHSSSSD